MKHLLKDGHLWAAVILLAALYVASMGNAQIASLVAAAGLPLLPAVELSVNMERRSGRRRGRRDAEEGLDCESATIARGDGP